MLLEWCLKNWKALGVALGGLTAFLIGSKRQKDKNEDDVILLDQTMKEAAFVEKTHREERRKLIIVARETPLSLIHINNMKTITKAGGIICPATPSFYSNPKTFEELAETVIDRVITLADLENISYSWGDKQ